MDEFKEPGFSTRIVPLSKIAGADPGIAKFFASADVTPTLRIDLEYWNRQRLAALLRTNPVHLAESRGGELRVIGGFRLFALAIALAGAGVDPDLLGFIHRGRISSARRKAIVEEEILALPALYRHLPGEAAAVLQLYRDHFAGKKAGALISSTTQADFYRATGFDRRNVRHRHDGETISPEGDA